MEKGCTSVQDCTGTVRNYECFRKGTAVRPRDGCPPPRRGESFGMAAATYCTASVRSNIDSIYDTYIRTVPSRRQREGAERGRTTSNKGPCCTHTPLSWTHTPQLTVSDRTHLLALLYAHPLDMWGLSLIPVAVEPLYRVDERATTEVPVLYRYGVRMYLADAHITHVPLLLFHTLLPP